LRDKAKLHLKKKRVAEEQIKKLGRNLIESEPLYHANEKTKARMGLCIADFGNCELDVDLGCCRNTILCC